MPDQPDPFAWTRTGVLAALAGPTAGRTAPAATAAPRTRPLMALDIRFMQDLNVVLTGSPSPSIPGHVPTGCSARAERPANGPRIPPQMAPVDAMAGQHHQGWGACGVV